MKKIFAKNRIIQFVIMLVSLVVLSTLISLVFSGFRWFSSFEEFVRRTEFGFMFGFFYGIGNWALSIIVATKFRWKENVRLYNTLSLLMFLSYGLIVSICIPYYFGVHRMGLQGQQLLTQISVNGFIGFALDVTAMIFYYSYYMSYNWNKTIQDNEKLKRENVEAKFQALKSQVNPHFLFNSLNTLTSLVEVDTGKSVTYIKKLSEVYRYVLENKDSELVPLAEELNFANTYLYLSKIRLDKGIEADIKVDAGDWLIAPIALQLLVENCIKHNELNEDNPVHLKVFLSDDYIVAENNIIKKTAISDKESQGLKNLISRYSYLTERSVVIEESSEIFKVRVPLIKAQK